jgi:rubrerythrin
MICLEAAGQGFYAAFVDAAPSAEVAALLAKNGQEELGHAHRVARALKLVYGEDFAVPEPADNPYYGKPAGIALSKAMLDGIAQTEIAGDALYEGWAVALGNEEAGRLLRQNGKEELGHAERMQRASSLLAA